MTFLPKANRALSCHSQRFVKQQLPAQGEANFYISPSIICMHRVVSSIFKVVVNEFHVSNSKK